MRSVKVENLKNGLFVTGTDTGVGKTLVTAGLVRFARIQGRRCVAIKPVETGCPVRSGMLHPEDGVFLMEASESDLSLDECAPFRFSLPAAPARAAAMEGSRIFLSDLVEHVQAVAESRDFVIAEGAGGLMVPIEDRLMMIDLVERLGCPVLLVARSRLGTINHTLLSVEALRRRDLEIAGIILSGHDEESGPEERYTRRDVERLVGDTPVTVLPYLGHEITTNPAKIAESMAEACGASLLRRWTGLETQH
ncbi:MAG: dethiobiotin synthase [Desulfomonilaceae bacterium]|nr:dethiobiotin synthase [Desulfomonilaceae bacterium]